MVHEIRLPAMNIKLWFVKQYTFPTASCLSKIDHNPTITKNGWHISSNSIPKVNQVALNYIKQIAQIPFFNEVMIIVSHDNRQFLAKVVNRILPQTLIAPCVGDGVGQAAGECVGGGGGRRGRAILKLPCPSDILSICHSVTTKMKRGSYTV